MTIEMCNALKREMEDAKNIEDRDRRHEAIMMVLGHQNEAIIDCQTKMSERVKMLVAEREKIANMGLGIKIGIVAAVAFVAIGGPVVAMKICQLTGMVR